MMKPARSPRQVLHTLALSSLTILALAASPALQAGKLYRWVDENGSVHYSDRVPPEQIRQGREELDEQGRTVKSVDRAKTEEEIAAAKREAEKQAEEKRLAQEKAIADRVLLQTYTSLDDIVRSRSRKLNAIEATIRVTEGRVDKLNEELARQTESAADVERRGEALPPALQETIASLKQQIDDNLKYIAGKRTESQALESRYNADIQRYKELKGLQ